jgi:hypothetical protein
LALIVGAVFALGAYFVVDAHTFNLTLEWIAIIAASVVAIGWFCRGIAVRSSLARQPHEDPMFHPGSMPWEW